MTVGADVVLSVAAGRVDVGIRLIVLSDEPRSPEVTTTTQLAMTP